LDLLGYTREEYVGRHISEFYADQSMREEILRRLINKEILSDFEARLRCKDGSIKHVLINSNVLWGKNGKFIHTHCFTRDITELKRVEDELKQSEARYTDLYENAPDMYVSISAKTAKILTCNKTLAKVLGYQKEEVIGLSVFDLYLPDCLEAAKEASRTFAEKGEVHDVELQLRRKDGSKIDVSLNSSAVRDKDGKILFSRSSWRDITERKRIEKQIEKDTKLQQEEAKVKGEFTSMVSHELRTPLQVIKGGVEIVLNGTLGSLNDEQKEQLDAVKRNIDRLTRLIHDVLDYQKLDSGYMQFQMRPINVNDLVRDTAELFTPLAEMKGLDLICHLNSDSENVVCDKDKIAQVLVNFIDNAVKFSKRGCVTVTSEKKENSIFVSVHDEGAGIKEEDQSKIFENFTQLSAGTKKGGTGLGLAICKKIVEGHGGQIGVESEPGKGSTFYFELPNGG
jgi:PAS domain S-box-containing protein